MASCKISNLEVYDYESNQQILRNLVEIFDSKNHQLVNDIQLANLINSWIEENNFDTTEIFKLVYSNITQIRTPSLLAIFYNFGIGTPRDPVSAFHWFEEAANRHDPLSQCIIGQCYQDQADFNTAFYWYKLSATKNHPEGQYHLAFLIIYTRTNNVEYNREKAFELMSQAALKNHLKAQYFLGNFYYDGTGISSNFEIAFNWYEKAASRGHQGAINKVAECYEMGCGTSYNIRKAFYWSLKGASIDSPEESFNNLDSDESKIRLADYYENGIGTEKDIHQSFRWRRRADELGVAHWSDSSTISGPKNGPAFSVTCLYTDAFIDVITSQIQI
ncbi:5477_t:CDS:2 [Ambispora gerdemannii]|uniref:5477_t:CDS:1 n=1 Tax=Ambispora gerdemannii TaxID=144530 RepID=A0A9N9GCE8_9GLOM|nr:5477_t:CDS:2 [Ambispora gerdemannii]